MKTSILLKEVTYRTARSSGSGGQHVNKVETKVELLFDIGASEGLDEIEKSTISIRLANKINKSGILLLQHSKKRSQIWNKKIVTQKFVDLMAEALTVQKERVVTKMPKAIKEKRLKRKKVRSDIKKMRKKINLDCRG